MARRNPTRHRTRGGEGISTSSATRKALALGAVSVGLAVGVTVWLYSVASADAAATVAALGGVAIACLVATLAVGRADSIVGALALLGAAYAAILVIDEPALDGRSAVIGAALLAIGELGYLSVEVRPAVTEEAGAATRRVAFVAMMTLLALGIGSAMLALVDLLRTGGIAIEAVGVAAAVGVIGLLVLVARDAPGRAARDRET